MASASEDRGEDRPASSDAQLIERTFAGDAAAAEALVARLRCVPPILAALDDRLGAQLTRDELADLAQDTLVRIWTKIATFEGTCRLETWVYGFCLRELLNRVRSKSRGKQFTGTLEPADEPASASLPPLVLDAEEIEHELHSLASPQADVIRMKHFDGLSFQEIGESLGIPPNSAKTHYYRGLSRLRLRLRRFQHEDRA